MTDELQQPPSNDIFAAIGQVSMRRLCRVLLQKWYIPFGAIALSVAIAYAICRFLPPTYETTATFTMELGQGGAEYSELFNTRYPEWHSKSVILGILGSYRTKRPASTISDEEVLDALQDSRITLKRESRLIQITIRASTAELSADLANAYVEAIAANSASQSDEQSKRAAKTIDESVEKHRRRLSAISHKTAASRVSSGMDSIRVDLDVADRSLAQTASQLLTLEGEKARLTEMAKILEKVADNPSQHAGLLASDPRSREISALIDECVEKETACRLMLSQVTKRHPVVRQAGRELLAARARLRKACRRARENGQASLAEIEPRIKALEKRKSELELEKATYIRALARAGEETERDVRVLKAAHATMEALLLEQNRVSAEAATRRETIVPGCPPDVPEKPIIPDPIIVYPTSLFIFAILGTFFALLLDAMKDPLTDIWDVMHRIGFPVLAVLPHVSARDRASIVRMLGDAPHSTFSECVKALINRLEAPVFDGSNRCILVVSTCPGEGKTITSASIAASYAQSGLSTLLADFDMRRPQQAGVWGLQLTPETSLSHALMAARHRSPNFAAIAQRTKIPGLDVMASLPPDEGIVPARAVGSVATRAFFAWAKATYDAIVIDAPPFGTVGDAVALSGMTDSVILMCRPDRTIARNLAGCAEYLSQAGANVLGIVINDDGANGISFTPDQQPHNPRTDTDEESARFADED